ncbi:MAG: squalene synthase HpnD [Betaproteobacteria bacterium]|nr:squalene synthase HpnD [Betaproteobacteria bacterium]
MTPDEYCRQKAIRNGSSIYYALLFLQKDRLCAITALQAFCSEIHNAVAAPGDQGVAQTKLAWWRSELGRLFAGNPQHPVTRALAPAVEPFALSRQRLNEIIDGMEMDLRQSRYLDFAGLHGYCQRAGGIACLLSASICGYSNPASEKYAIQLGIALKLTRIIRDVGLDARNNRIYLPMDELKRFEVSAADILKARHSENFARLMDFQAARAEKLYQEACALLPAEDRRAQRPGLIMAAIQRTLLEEIRGDGFKVLTQRTALTPARKLWIAWKTRVRT